MNADVRDVKTGFSWFNELAPPPSSSERGIAHTISNRSYENIKSIKTHDGWGFASNLTGGAYGTPNWLHAQ